MSGRSLESVTCGATRGRVAHDWGIMKRVQQSEMSIAAAAFLFSGTCLALLNATALRQNDEPRPDLFATALAGLVACGVILLLGRRFTRAAAGTLMVLVLLVVVPSVLLVPTMLRAVNLGLLFLPFFLFLVWFMPMWFARLLGSVWILLYAAIMLGRFGIQMGTVVLTIGVTGIVIGELVGHFKARLERTSLTDPLCDVWNKRGFERLLGSAVTAAERGGHPLSLLYLDLDGFKAVNDALGHGAGDALLRGFATQMGQRTRPEDVFARFGGDEFALLLVDVDQAGAVRTAERLRGVITEPAWSFGVSEWRPGESSAEFIERADLLMLSAKRRGRPLLAERAESPGTAVPEWGAGTLGA